MERFEPTFIVVDITHGVNYQMTAILYATMAAAALTGMDDRVEIFNSEPYPRRRRESPQQQPQLSQQPLQDKHAARALRRRLGKLRGCKLSSTKRARS